MIKRNKRIIIPLAIVGAMLIYCWIIIFTNAAAATWRQYLGIAFFSAIVIYFINNFVATAIVLTGVFLLFGTFNLLAITPGIYVVGLQFFASVSTPPIQPIFLGIFALYFWLNLDPLINIYLDYKEAKLNKTQNRKS